MSGWSIWYAPADSTTGTGATEGIDIEADGRGKGKDGAEVVHALSLIYGKSPIGAIIFGQRVIV